MSKPRQLCHYTHCDTIDPYPHSGKLKNLGYNCPEPEWYYNACSNKGIDTRLKDSTKEINNQMTKIMDLVKLGANVEKECQKLVAMILPNFNIKYLRKLKKEILRKGLNA